MKQQTLFGGIAKEKSSKFYVYRDPKNDYECFIERYCLRNKNGFVPKQQLVKNAQEAWSKHDKERRDAFLVLRPGEKSFVK